MATKKTSKQTTKQEVEEKAVSTEPLKEKKTKKTASKKETVKKETKEKTKPSTIDVKDYMALNGISDPKLPKKLKDAAEKTPEVIPPTDKETILRKIKVTYRCRMDTMENRDRINKRIMPYKREDGSEYIPPYDDDEMREFRLQAGMYEGLANIQTKQLETYMKQLPIWNLWMKDVPGMGPNIAAAILGSVRFDKSEKPSNLIQFCGVGFVIDADGKFVAQRKQKGQLLGYNEDIRKALYVYGSVIIKGQNLPSIRESKYFKIYQNKYLGLLAKNELSPFMDEKKIKKEQKIIFAKSGTSARRLMCRVLVEDMYFVGRALEGLPIWPDYYATRLGYAHGGKVVVNKPVKLSVEKALEIVKEPYVDWPKLQKTSMAAELHKYLLLYSFTCFIFDVTTKSMEAQT